MLRQRWLRAVGIVLAVAVLSGLIEKDASAQKAMILHSTRAGESGWTEYIKKVVGDSGLYPDGVSDADTAYNDPTLTQLKDYKLVVCIGSDFGLNSGDGMGNPLGDYMAMVPGASVLVFYPYLWQTGLFAAPPIGGRFATTYGLTTPTATSVNSAAKLGMTTAGDPLTAGLAAFSCGTNCRRVTGLMAKPGATVAALWDDGNILAVRGRNRVDLNMWPADDSVITGSWAAAGQRLITNALVYLSSPLAASPGEITFPATPLGSASTPVTVTFKNNARTPLSITEFGIDGADKGMFQHRSLSTPTFASPLVVAAGGTFKVTMTYKPLTQGNHAGVFYAAIIGFGRSEVNLRGSSKGNLFVSGAPIDFGGIPTGTTKGPVTVRLTNAGGVDINLEKPTIGNSMQYELVPFVGFPTVKLSPGSTYQFNVTFKPGMTPGEFPTTVTVKSDDPSSPLEIPVRGLAGPPKLVVPGPALLLPDVAFGTMGIPLEIVLTNTGNSELSVTDATSDSMDFVVTMPMKPLKIQARESAAIQLVFAPKMAGLRTGKLTIKSNEPPEMGMMTSDKIIDLAGTATMPKFRVSTKSVDFGTASIGKPNAPKSLTLFNDGDGALRVTSLEILAGPSSDSFKVVPPGALPLVIAAGGSVSVNLLLDPKSAGMLSANMRVVTDLMMMGTEQVELKALVNGALAQVSQKSIDFGNQKVKTSATKKINIKNGGNQDLTIRGAKLTQPPMAMGSFSLKPVANVKVAAGMSTDIEVTFSPTVAGMLTAKVDIDTDDPAVMGGTQFAVDVTGVGVTGNVSIRPTTLDFTPAIYVGLRSPMQVITVKNIGDVSIDEIAVKISGPDASQFSRVGMFMTKLAPNESTDIGFVFEPTLAKAQMTATVIIEADKVQVPMMVTLKGSSISPILRVQPSTLKFDNTAAMEKSSAKTVTLVNDGPEKLELDIPGAVGEDFVVDTSQTDLNLPPGETTKFTVTFEPKSTGTKAETLEIRLKGSNVVAETVSLDGEAVKKVEMPMGGCSLAPAAPASGPGALGATVLLGLGLCLVRRRKRG